MLQEIPCTYYLVWISISTGSYRIFHVKYCEVPCMHFQSCKNEVIVEQFCMSVCMYVCICVCMYMCMYVCVYVHIIIITMSLIWLPRSSHPILHCYVLMYAANYNLQYNSSSPDIISWKYLSRAQMLCSFTDAGIHKQSFKECDFCYFHSQLAILKFSASQISLVKDWFVAIGKPDKHEQ